MTKDQLLEVLMLLSALEAWSYTTKHELPPFLFDRLTATVQALEAEIFK